MNRERQHKYLNYSLDGTSGRDKVKSCVSAFCLQMKTNLLILMRTPWILLVRVSYLCLE